jgi:membrane protease YdiL (CAAX protease family)
MRREVGVLSFALFFPSVAASIYLIALGGGQAAGSGTVQFAYGASKFIQFAFPIAYLFLVEPSALRTLGVRPRGALLGIGFGVIVGLGIIVQGEFFLPTWLPDLPTQLRRKTTDFGVDRPGAFLALAAFLCIVHSFLEEYYWRWFVFGRLRRLKPFGLAAIISALGFMAHHVFVLHQFLPAHFLTAVIPGSLAIAVGGVVWAWLFEKTGSITAPWLSHLLVDVAIMYVGYRQVFTP